LVGITGSGGPTTRRRQTITGTVGRRGPRRHRHHLDGTTAAQRHCRGNGSWSSSVTLNMAAYSLTAKSAISPATPPPARLSSIR